MRSYKYNFDLFKGHVIIRNGGSYLLDTGAPWCVDESGEFCFAGNEHLAQTSYLGVNMRRFSQFVGTPLDAIIGMDAIRDFNMVIDPKMREFRLRKGALETANWFAELPMRIPPLIEVPIAEVQLSCGPVRMIFDTGAPLSYLSREIAVHYPRTGTAKDFYPTKGWFETETYRVPIELGTETIEIEVGVLQTLVERGVIPSLLGFEGIIGTTLLSDFVVGLVPEEKLVLQKIVG